MVIVEPTKMEGGFLSMVIYDVQTQTLLPASVSSEGVVVTEWDLTEEERENLFMGGHVRVRLKLPALVAQGVIPISIDALEPPQESW